MKVLKTIANCCVVFLCVVSVCVIIGFIYYHYFVKDTTIGVNNIDNQVGLDVQDILKSEDLTEEEKNELKDRYFLEVNYYSNEKGNGIMLQEIKMNYFTTTSLLSADYRSTGMQYLGDYQGLPLDVWNGDTSVSFINPFSNKNDRYYGTDDNSIKLANDYVDKSFNYYDSTNGINWNGVTNENGSIATELKRSTEFIIKIDDRAFAISLDKYFDRDVGDLRNFFGIGWKVGDIYNRYYYTYGSLFQSCMQAVKTNSAGYGDYYITVDLSSLFSIKEYDYETKKFKTDDVTDVIKTYSVLKFHYDENGARNSTQSMFGIIDNNSKYDVSEDKINTSYWQERMTYNLDVTSKLRGEEIFSYRYSEVYDRYFVSLTMDAKKLFAEIPRAKINITLDLDAHTLEHNIVGLDYNAFENLEIDTLNEQKTALQGQIDTLNTIKTSNEATITDLNEQIAALNNQVLSLQANKNENERQIESLNTQISNLQTLNNQLQENNEPNTRTINGLNAQIAILNNQIADLTLQAQNNSAIVNALNVKIADCKNRSVTTSNTFLRSKTANRLSLRLSSTAAFTTFKLSTKTVF